MKRFFDSACLAAWLLFTPVSALADAIDGTWCSPAGEQVTIDGENVTTPGGQQVKGAYTRHTMAFQIPPASPEPERSSTWSNCTKAL